MKIYFKENNKIMILSYYLKLKHQQSFFSVRVVFNKILAGQARNIQDFGEFFFRKFIRNFQKVLMLFKWLETFGWFEISHIFWKSEAFPENSKNKFYEIQRYPEVFLGIFSNSLET